MDSSSASARRRISTISDHLVVASFEDADSRKKKSDQIFVRPTAGEFINGDGYSVVLPEKLQTGKWNVYRSAHSPLKLMNRFADHPEIATLHDNFGHAADAYCDYKYLGTRIRFDGSLGEYKWMTYGEASTSRTAIGSGLVCHGILQGACIGLYFINRPEWIIVDHACSAYSYISVPLYDILGPDAVRFIVNHASIQAIFCVPQTLSMVRFCVFFFFQNHFIL
ncbi:hypothetical protein ZOSMA_270G00010 [Zostera marina]|uniref:AMP-dependent synthetase/ligase domain-containing protein n=1 Tax=Zostera marina TaxID=29655 RepID=A0A0K9PG97_ZOSMR|nr:hypothetical protein ZOSMA_270G00010 [Zostera marina]